MFHNGSGYNNPDMNDDDEAISLTTDAQGNVYVTRIQSGNRTFKIFLTLNDILRPVNELWVARYNGTGI